MTNGLLAKVIGGLLASTTFSLHDLGQTDVLLDEHNDM
jgi:hypothetical protein